MKIRRFVAKDMRTALAEIKEELGPDAVIMSNKKTPEGVELMAAVDYSTVTPDAEPPLTKPTQQARQNSQDWAGFGSNANSPVTQQENSSFPTAKTAQPAMAQQPKTYTANEPQQAPADSLQALLQRQANKQAPAVNQVQTAQTLPPQQSVNQAVDYQLDQRANQNESLDLSQELRDFSARLASAHPSQEASIHEQTSAQYAEQNTQSMPRPQQTKEQVDDRGFSTRPAKTNELNQVFSNQANIYPEQSSVANLTEFAAMKEEMASIRKLLENQVSGLMWQDLARKEPMRAMIVKRLLNLGLTEVVADQLACFIPDDLGDDEAWSQVKEMLAGQINTTNNDIIHRGGVVSLVGPTGVGKTTTIAKLAARFAQIHGADQLVLISADSYRIAGHEQLATYGKIIGCQVKLAKDAQSLNDLLLQYRNKKLILIDTAGMGQRDLRLAQELSNLVQNTSVKIRNYLVLSANAQQRVLQDSVERFKKIPLSGCIFTKLDETLSVGEIIATSIQNCLPIGYLTDGQRVPEDIRVANAEKLVTMAESLSEDKPKGYEWMPEEHHHKVG